MNLQTVTENALDLTRRLQAALRLGDLDLCTDLMDLRSQAMESFVTHAPSRRPDRGVGL